MDYTNKIFVSSGSDKQVLLQRLNEKGEPQLLKSISHFREEIGVMQFSVYHNLLVVGGSYSNKLYFFSYESCHLLLEYSLSKDVEATAITFINGFSILVVATNNNYILFFRFSHQ